MNNGHKTPPILREIASPAKTVRNVNVAYRQKLSGLDKIALWITEKVGSMGFFLIVFWWTIVWLAWNTIGPASLRFDPFPAFVLWLFISNAIQLFLTPLLMVGQNLQSRRFETRAEIDFEINMKAEKEIETIIFHLEHQHDLILKLLEKIGVLEKKKSAPRARKIEVKL